MTMTALAFAQSWQGEAAVTEPAASRPSPSLAELVVAARGGDRDAFAAIYGRFAGAVNAVVLARVRWADCADLVQDVFLLAWERLGAVRDPAAFPGWLMTIARNRAIDHVRRPRLVEALPDVADLAAGPAPTAEAREVLAAIRTLPEAYREVLLMRLVEGMSGPEIAERTGLAEGSVRVNLHRGMKLLRERLHVEEEAS